MAAPVLETWAMSKDTGAEATSITLTAPSGIQAGDLLIIICGSDDSSSVPDKMSINGTTYPGWTEELQVGDATNDVHIGFWWKEAAGTEGSVVVDDALNNHIGWYLRISGADTVAPIDAQNSGLGDGADTFFNATALSHSVDTLGICISAWDGGDCYPLTMSGSGWSETDDQRNSTSTAVLSANFGTSTDSSTSGPNVTSQVSDGYAYIKTWIAPGGIDIDNLSGVDGGNIVQISDVDVGDIVKFSGVPF
jgi:hypothetical protein